MSTPKLNRQLLHVAAEFGAQQAVIAEITRQLNDQGFEVGFREGSVNLVIDQLDTQGLTVGGEFPEWTEEAL